MGDGGSVSAATCSDRYLFHPAFVELDQIEVGPNILAAGAAGLFQEMS